MKYYAKSNIIHDTVSYKKGDVVEISGEAAELLVKDGVLSTDEVSTETVETPAPEVTPAAPVKEGPEAAPADAPSTPDSTDGEGTSSDVPDLSAGL